ncbi:neuropeptide receptor 15 [Aplysia californica]|uniref:Neuropeptide receptor 15 n=1 Tax=Aplysia californica TaxID=6500 RepID=A0ABM0JE50_APLCA|nr:neuropeptide receptor 15 [Aplysia californica]
MADMTTALPLVPNITMSLLETLFLNTTPGSRTSPVSYEYNTVSGQQPDLNVFLPQDALDYDGMDSSTTLFSDNFSSPAPNATLGKAMSFASTVAFPLIFSIIVLVGIAGNCLVIVVILRDSKMRKSKTNLLIINLAVADVTIMTFGIPEIAMFVMNRGWLLGLTACKLNRFTLVFALYSSVISLVILCCERFIGIVFPFKVRELCTRKKIVGIIMVTWPVSALCALPVLLYNVTVQTGPNMEHCKILLPGSNKRRSFLLYKYLEAAFFYFLPMLIQVVLYSITCKRLFSSNKQLSTKLQSSRYKTNGRNKDDDSDTKKARIGVVKMLIASVSLYFISYSPLQIHLIYSTFARSSILQSWEFFAFVMIITHVNSAANPILYGIFSQNFRRNFRRCLHSGCKCDQEGYLRARLDTGDSRHMSTRSSSTSKMLTDVSKL